LVTHRRAARREQLLVELTPFARQVVADALDETFEAFSETLQVARDRGALRNTASPPAIEWCFPAAE
jgi:hypothetical protein